MKRYLTALLVICLLLSGCSVFGQRLQEPVTFYYVNRLYQENMEPILADEQREAAGHREDLSYMLALYLMGPSEEDSISPVPRGTRVLRAEKQEEEVFLKLSDTDESMSDSEFTIACACLSMTCMELTGLEQVTITGGSRTVTMTRDNLIQFDDPSIITTEETQ